MVDSVDKSSGQRRALSSKAGSEHMRHLRYQVLLKVVHLWP